MPTIARLLIRSAVAAVLAAVPLAAVASPAQAAEGSYIRLAHLSPDTPNVDVYLTAFGRPSFNVTIRGVGYGVISDYQRIEPGQYTVSMRAAGAAASTPPVISTNVQVAAGTARTVAGVGKYSSLGLTVINDDLALPPTGQARVRVIHASARVPSMDVKCANGPTIATAAKFATTSEYAAVRAGKWTLEMGPSAGAVATRSPIDLAAGGVYSVIVLDAKGSGLQVVSRVDAQGAQVVPAGGVDTGFGGTQRDGASPLLPLGGAAAVLMLVAGLLAWRRAAGREVR